MVTLHRGPNWKVSVYAGDPGVPHFHIEGPGFRCSVAIATRQVIIGVVPRKVELAALEWASDRQAELLATWQELNP